MRLLARLRRHRTHLERLTPADRRRVRAVERQVARKLREAETAAERSR